MAPSITIYYHKLAASSHGAMGKSNHRATLKIDRPPLPISRVTSKFTLILGAAKATKHECTKAISPKAFQVVSKNRKTVTKKSSKILATKVTMGKVGILKPTMTAVSQLYPHQIMIGSIPIELPTTVSAMATSIKEEESVLMTTPKVTVMQTPKRAEINTSSKKVAEVESFSTSAKSKNTSTQFVSTTVRWRQNKESLESKRGTEKPKVWDTPEAAMYPLSGYYAEISQNAKSNLEKKRWAFMCGYLLAKEALYGQGAPLRPTQSKSPYTSSTAWFRTQLKLEPLTKEPTLANQGSDHSKDFQPSSKNDLLQFLSHSLPNQAQPTLTPRDSSILSSPRLSCEESQCENMPVLITGAISQEEQLHEMQQKLAEKDTEIGALKTQIANQTSSSAIQEKEVDLRKLIAEGIREFKASLTSPFIGYQKPYPVQYDTISFPTGYEKPNFQTYDGINGSPQEHLAHFYSICGQSAELDSLLLRQFEQSLKGAAFTWYTSLQPGSIQTWEDMQRAFLAQFVGSEKNVSIIDLADAIQKPNERVNDFITRWKSLNLQCSEKLTEQSAVQMCSNNLDPDIAIHMGTAKPQTFDELVSKVSNVERQNAISRETKISHERNCESNKSSEMEEESLATFIHSNEKDNQSGEGKKAKRTPLKERKDAKYRFHDDDVEALFKELIKEKAINLPVPKRAHEVNKINHPKYCQYHRIVSHPLCIH